MKIEKLTYSSSDRCINIAAGQVESLRINNDLENTVRVYDGGNIGVEGKLGNADFDKMTEEAKAKLAQGITYPETHDEPLVIHVDTTADIMSTHDFVPYTQKLLARLGAENPQFLFSNKIQLNSSEATFSDSDGRDLSYKGNQYVIALTIKYKGSANIMDEFYGAESDYYNEDEICDDVRKKCDAFLKELPQLTEEEVTVIGELEPLQYALSGLIAEVYFSGSSLFSGKLGQKLFNDNFSLRVDRDPSKQINLKFFDAEGVVNKDYVNYIVKDGILTRLLTCKKSAAEFGTENLGGAAASYDGVPTFGAVGLDVEKCDKTAGELAGKKAIYLSVTSGGDMTPSGDISMPSIVSYLVEDGQIVGKLPEFTVCGNIFDILGKDFIGVTDKGFFSFGRQNYFVYKAKIVNKK